MQITCVECGTSMAGSDIFCGNCGRTAEAPGGTTTIPVPAATEPATTANGSTAWHPTPASNVALAVLPAPGQFARSPQRYEPPPDPIFNLRFIWQMTVRAWLFAWVYCAAGAVSFLFFAIAGLVTGSFGGFILFYYVCAAIVGLAFLCCFWLIRIPAQIAGWSVSLDAKAGEAGTAFDHTAWALRRRGAPLDLLQVRRMELPGDGQRDYLEARRGLFSGYVSCFPFGNDLHVSWTFWVQLTPLWWLCLAFLRIWQTVIVNRGSDLYVTLRYQSALAMRDSLYSSVLEGTRAAAGDIPAQGRGTIGTAVKVV